MPHCEEVSIFSTLRTAIKAVGLIDDFLDEYETESAARQAEIARKKKAMKDIAIKAADLAGKR